MKRLGPSRYALAIGAAAALLGGCGGSQPPIGAPGAMPQTSAIATHADRGKSWMLPEGKTADLLYAPNTEGSTVLVFSYPQGKPVGELSGFNGNVNHVCTDRSGDIFVTVEGATSQSYIYEFAHGGAQPIATLVDPGFPFGCAVDPTTGNLAVANILGPSDHGSIAVFEGAQGTPTIYTDPNLDEFLFCAYDDSGNLYADASDVATLLDELPANGNGLIEVTFNKGIYPASIQWNKGGLAIADGTSGNHGEQAIYQVQVRGTSATIESTTWLWSLGNRKESGVQFWIQGNKIIGPDHTFNTKGRLEFWRFPKGGRPTKVIQPRRAAGLTAAVVSIAPR
jgi:hypothetical protein